MQTPLHDVLTAAGASFGEFGGATTAASFGNGSAEKAKEFTALQSGCAIYDLGYRAKLTVSGSDRTRWLNGMLTNNIRDLASGRGCYNFLLNAQGHILADMYVYNGESFFVLDTDLSQEQRVLELFDKYIIMDDVQVHDAKSELTAVGVAGPHGKAVMEKVGLKVPSETLAVADQSWQGEDVFVPRMDFPANGFQVWISPARIADLWRALIAEATPVGYEALELARVAAGIPRFGVDMREKDLPQETAQQRALNFNKGCYLGQEIVERIHARGAVHRTLAGLEVQQGAPVPGAKVTTAGKEVGQVTSVVHLPNGSHRTLALGYLRREAAQPGTEVEIEGAKARVAALPFATQEKHG